MQTGSFGWDVATNQAIDPTTVPSISVGTAHGTVDPTSYYLVVNGIAGDDADTSNLLTGAFKVIGFDQPTNHSGPGLPNFGQLQVTLNGQTVAGLLAAEASGEHIKGASLVGVTTISGKSSISYSLNLTDVLVTGILAANAPTSTSRSTTATSVSSPPALVRPACGRPQKISAGTGRQTRRPGRARL